MKLAKEHKFIQCGVGRTASRCYRVTEEVYDGFLRIFGDRNPMHVDDRWARKAGFASRLMHGAILNGFLSHFVGMHYPGRHALLQSVEIQYRLPVYCGDMIRIYAQVRQQVSAVRVVVMDYKFVNLKTRNIVATAKAQIGMTK